MRHISFLTFVIWLVVIFQCAFLTALALPVEKSIPSGIVIDAAPSVVAYQGSSQTHARLVLAPMGRSLGYVEPIDVNRTVAHTERLDDRFGALDITPIYVHQ